VQREAARPRLKLFNGFTLWVLRSPALHRLADRQVIELRFTARRSGREIGLPVMYAQHGVRLVVLVGGAEGKRWWHTFRKPHPVSVLLRGATHTGVGRVVAVGDAQRRELAEIYRARFPGVPPGDDPFVLITLDAE
jgi:hypothetical protein